MPALDGMRILDMTQWEAGTAATQALAWLGADVVKVEPPVNGEPGRSFGQGGSDSPYFIAWNSNKRAVAIDLNKPEGRKLLLDMLPHYDVFVENYGPGVIEKLDLGYEVMKKIHPTLIYARVKGFGSTGPQAHYKVMDMIAQAASGAMSVTGNNDGPPMRPGPTIADSGTGTQLALAIAAAFIQRERTGEGQLIELSMQEAMMYYMRTMIATASNWGEHVAPRTGNGFGALMNLYPCRGDGANDYLYIMIVNDRMWQALARAMDREDLISDPRFSFGESISANSEALSEEIAKWTREYDKREAMEIIAGAGVPCSMIYDTQDLFNDPHLEARGFIQDVEHPAHGSIRLPGSPMRLSKSEVELRVAPALGQHTHEVLAQDLGYSENQFQELIEKKVVG
ncbi:MAG: CoA transferase [bacterium]|nr:CoA transferase [bacterium]